MITVVKNWRLLKLNKSVWFHVVPYIHSPLAFPAHISCDHNHSSRCKSTVFKLNELNRQDKIYFGAMPSPNIPSLTVLLKNYQIN